MSSVKLNSKNVVDPLLNRMNFNTNKYNAKERLTLKDVEFIEKKMEALKKYIGYKPLYNLYKSKRSVIKKLLDQKFFKFYKTPSEFYDFTYFTANNNEFNNNSPRNLTNTNVSKKKHNFGDFVNFSNYRLTKLYYVDENYKLQPANGEYYMAIKDKFSKYVNDIEYKLTHLWDEIVAETLEIDELSLRYNDKCLIREFKGEFPRNYKVTLVPSIDDINTQFALIISNGAITLPEIPVKITSGKIKLSNSSMSIDKVNQMFARLSKIKRSQNKLSYYRFKKNAYVPKNKYHSVLRPELTNFLKKHPTYFVQYSGAGSSQEKTGVTMNFIGILKNEFNNVQIFHKYFEKNGNNYKNYKPNNVFGYYWPNYLTKP